MPDAGTSEWSRAALRAFCERTCLPRTSSAEHYARKVERMRTWKQCFQDGTKLPFLVVRSAFLRQPDKRPLCRAERQAEFHRRPRAERVAYRKVAPMPPDYELLRLERNRRKAARRKDRCSR